MLTSVIFNTYYIMYISIIYLGVECGINALLLEGRCEKVNSALREKTFFIFTRQLQGPVLYTVGF